MAVPIRWPNLSRRNEENDQGVQLEDTVDRQRSQRSGRSSRSRRSRPVSIVSEPKTPDVRTHEESQSILTRLQSALIPRRRRGDAPQPPLPPPQMSATAGPGQFPMPELRPQTARSTHSQRTVGRPSRDGDLEALNRTETNRIRTPQKPWWKRPELKTRVVVLMVWTGLLLIVVSLYLGLAVQKRLATQEVHVAMILIILIAAMFFCHSLIRLCVIATRSPDDMQEDEEGVSFSQLRYYGPLGYAQPREPIRIHEVPGQATAALNDDYDGDHDGSQKLPPPPPAYGVWRASVRVNPNQFYWMRRTSAEASPPQSRGVGGETIEEVQTPRSATAPNRDAQRPPSYASADRVHFETTTQESANISSQQSNIARLPIHPSERTRTGTL